MEWCIGLKKHGNYYSGFVERLEPVLQSHRIATTTTWGIRTSITHGCTNDAGSKQELLEDGDGEKENDPSMMKPSKLYWTHKFGDTVAEFNNTPFTIVRTQYLDCQHGRHYFKKYERKSDRVCLQSTRKFGCPAHVVIKEFKVFPQFCVELDGLSARAMRKVKEDKLHSLKSALAEGTDIESVRRFYVSLPTNEAHQKHFIGPIAGVVQKVSPVVAAKIEELVKEGYSDVAEVQRYLEQFVKAEFRDQLPDKTNRAYYPTPTDIRNHMYKARLGLQFSKLDQVNLQELVARWRNEKQNEKFFFRPCSDQQSQDDPNASESLLWVHQVAWQQELLIRYGNYISLIDATYKTMRYELPLFFVCVRTNVGYCVVADFIVQSECAVSIKEALLVLRSWNPEWNPPFFMSDFSEAEISALEQTFPGVTVYGCDFHREQAWTRWIQDHKNALSADEREQLLSLLRDCAWAPSASELACDFHYKQSLEKLQKSTVWKQHENVRNWLVGSWLNSPKHWARAFRDHNFYAAVDTNNGTEAMNKLFKYKFMPRRKSFTLFALVTQLSDRFLPDLHRNYVLQNLKGSPMYREYNDVVPNYLHGKPRSVVLQRKARSNRYDDEDIVLSEDGIFKIKKLDTFKHTVNFLQPSCTCKDCIRWHLPCKHMFAVISLKAEWGWNALPKSYRESPYLQANNDAIVHYYGDSGVSGEQQVQMVEETDATLISMSDNQCSTPANIQKSQGGIKRHLKTESVKARQMLKQLEILTYSMDNIDVLVNFNQCLKKLYEETQSKMPKKEGLLCRRRGDTSVIISRRKIKRARTTLLCSTLPRCKRAKQSKVKQRVGLKAEKKKVARLAKQKAEQPAIVQEEEMAQEGLNIQEAVQLGRELQEPSIVTAGTKIGGKGKRICGQCTGCLATDCGKCVNCVDKKKIGGPGKRKQRCKERQCQGL